MIGLATHHFGVHATVTGFDTLRYSTGASDPQKPK